jgi:hypothetical protein
VVQCNRLNVNEVILTTFPTSKKYIFLPKQPFHPAENPKRQMVNRSRLSVTKNPKVMPSRLEKHDAI